MEINVDIDIQAVSKENYVSGLADYNHSMLEGNDWMSLKNCTFLDHLIAGEKTSDKEIWDAYEKYYFDDWTWISKPFGISEVERAIKKLKDLDDTVSKMPFCPMDRDWTNDENKAITEIVEQTFEDSIHLFVFPWDANEEEPMGSWKLRKILERALLNMRKMPEDTVFYLEMV